MDESLEKALLDMEAHDQSLRAELTAAGALNVTYHAKLEELHRANASRLRQIIFGGTTRHILANATLPVLMAH